MKTHPRRRIGILTGLVLASCSAALEADSIVRLAPGTPRHPLAEHVECLVDPGGRFSLAEVSSGPLAGRFTTQAAALAGGYDRSRDTLWTRFRLAREGPEPWVLRIATQGLDAVCVHWPRTGGYTTTCTGTAEDFSTRALPHKAFVFPVPADLTDQPVYVATRSLLTRSLPLDVVALDALYEEVRQDRYKKGIYYGFLLAILLYNLFLYISARDGVYLFYVLHLGTFGLGSFGLDGLGAEYLWPEMPKLRYAYLFPWCSTYFFGAFYVRRFLLTRRHTRRLDLALLAVAIIDVVGSALLFIHFTTAIWLVSSTMMLFPAVVLVATIARLRQGYRPAWFLLVALVLFLCTLPMQALAAIGVGPWSTATATDLLRLAAALAALVLSLGLADRLRQLAAERERLIPALEEKNAEMEHFLYTVSHELRAPLVTIGNYLGLVKRNAAAGEVERLEDNVDTIQAAARQMQHLLNGLLELARLGRIVHPSERVAVEALAREAAERLGGPIAARGAVVDVAPGMPEVFGDRDRLLDVLEILFDNALKFTTGKSPPRIEVGVRHGEGEVVFFVRDHGLGIDPAYHEKVFGLFDRLDARGEGIGVGLTLARRIIELHGGRIWVESAGRGQGSTFCFTLPQAEDRRP